MKHPVVSVLSRLVIISFLAGCDLDPFGFGTKQVAGGYTLVETDEQNVFALISPRTGIGSDVDELGWRRPIILSRSGWDRPWGVIDTTTGKETTINDAQRRTDPLYRDIPIYDTKVAWDKLSHRKRQW